MITIFNQIHTLLTFHRNVLSPSQTTLVSGGTTLSKPRCMYTTVTTAVRCCTLLESLLEEVMMGETQIATCNTTKSILLDSLLQEFTAWLCMNVLD